MNQTINKTMNKTMNRTKIHEPWAKPWTINQGLTLSTPRSSFVYVQWHLTTEQPLRPGSGWLSWRPTTTYNAWSSSKNWSQPFPASLTWWCDSAWSRYGPSGVLTRICHFCQTSIFEFEYLGGAKLRNFSPALDSNHENWHSSFVQFVIICQLWCKDRSLQLFREFMHFKTISPI